MATCSAPRRGHVSVDSARRCPVHGVAATVPTRLGSIAALSPIARYRLLASTGDSGLIAQVADQGDATARQALLRNENVPNEVRHALAADGHAMVRSEAAITSTDPDLLTRLASDRSPHVRRRVADSRFTPNDVRERLLDDRDRLVSEQAKAYFKRNHPGDFYSVALRHMDHRDLARVVASDPRTAGSLLQQCFDHQDTYVVAGAATNPNATTEQLSAAMHRAASHADRALALVPSMIHEAVAAHPRASATSIAWLAQYSGSTARQAVARRSTLSSAVRRRLLADPDSSVRAQMAEHQRLTPDEAIAFSRDRSPEVKVALLKRHDIPPRVLRALSSARNGKVQEAVREHARRHLVGIGVAQDNEAALDYLAGTTSWWDLTEGDAATEMGLILFPNP